MTTLRMLSHMALPVPDEAPVRRSEEDWHGFYFSMALLVESRSKDPNRRVGAVLVTPDRRQLSIGYNGLPTELPDEPHLLRDREFKLRHVVHAERNCLRQAPFSPVGATLYSTSFPCYDCADLLCMSGVGALVAPAPDLGHARWGDSWYAARARMQRCGVRLVDAGALP